MCSDVGVCNFIWSALIVFPWRPQWRRSSWKKPQWKRHQMKKDVPASIVVSRCFFICWQILLSFKVIWKTMHAWIFSDLNVVNLLWNVLHVYIYILHNINCKTNPSKERFHMFVQDIVQIVTFTWINTMWNNEMSFCFLFSYLNWKFL